MKAAGISCLLAVSAFFSVGAFAGGEPADIAAMHAVDQAWLKAYNAGDANALAGLYDDNAILMPPGAPAAHGRSAIRSFLTSDTAAAKKAGVVLHFGSKPDGGSNGDMGWVSGAYSVTDSTGKVVETGKYLSVSKKEGGQWFYIRDTWNADSAPQQPQPAAKK